MVSWAWKNSRTGFQPENAEHIAVSARIVFVMCEEHATEVDVVVLLPMMLTTRAGDRV